MCSLSSKQNTLRGTGKESKNKEMIVTSLNQLNSVLLHQRFFYGIRSFSSSYLCCFNRSSYLF